VGYALIAFVLLPLYYALRVTSIYELLAARLGGEAQRSGARLLRRLAHCLGATARLYLVGARAARPGAADRLGNSRSG
jgi:hypothetical protein